MSLQSLTYTSSAVRIPSAAEIDQLLMRARARNERENITGLLLYSDGSFLQVLEGPPEAVSRVFASIREDPLHHHVTELLDEPIDDREFADWSMAYRAVGTASTDSHLSAKLSTSPGVLSGARHLTESFWNNGLGHSQHLVAQQARSRSAATAAPVPTSPPVAHSIDAVEQELEHWLVATSDYTDDALPASLHKVLRALRLELAMDVVFIARIADGQRTFVSVDTAPEHQVIREGMSDPVEQSWCHNIVQGRLPGFIRDAKPLIEAAEVPYTPLAIGTHLSVPILLANGQVYGTLCTFALNVQDLSSYKDLTRLRLVARMLGSRLHENS